MRDLPLRAVARMSSSRHVRALIGYSLLTVVFCWPLPAHLSTRLLGPPGGDTGVYVWNLWVFHHELWTGHHVPFFTSTIFSLDPRADLSLHNYTVFADLLAFPLLHVTDIVATFNLLNLLMVVVNAYAMFLLARRLAADGVAAWLAGALFAWGPVMVARSTAHFSLVMAAPLVVFMWILLRIDQAPRLSLGVAAGAAAAWAAACDPYYGVYCLVLGGWHVAARSLGLGRASGEASSWRARAVRWLEVAIGFSLALVAWILISGGFSPRLLGRSLHLKSLYTPVLVLTILVGVRLALRLGVRVTLRRPLPKLPTVRLAGVAALTCVVLMAPLLYALGRRIVDKRYVEAPVYWRSSMPGVDVAAFLLPNPNHPLFAPLSAAWLAAQPGGYAENVASLTLTALLVIAAAVVLARFRLPAYWLALALGSAAVAAGPFFRFAGVMTFVPTPWAILRYLPLIGAARAPARFMAIVMMALAVLFAVALTALRDRFASRRGAVGALAGALLLFELWPAPRTLYSAEVPAIYHQVAADPRDVRVLELPFGIRDGLSSLGNFNAASQFYQTFHGKHLIGGYLSRVSKRRAVALKRRPMLKALAELSEGREVPPETRRQLHLLAPSFVRHARVAYVVIDRAQASEALATFAIDTLNLEKLGEAGDRELYRPRWRVQECAGRPQPSTSSPASGSGRRGPSCARPGDALSPPGSGPGSR